MMGGDWSVEKSLVSGKWTCDAFLQACVLILRTLSWYQGKWICDVFYQACIFSEEKKILCISEDLFLRKRKFLFFESLNRFF